MHKQPIGILDSGVGGLTIFRELTRYLPHEATVYIGDSVNAPYGKRSQKEIQYLTKKLIHFLRMQQVKLIVIACNTITVSGIIFLRHTFPDIPIIGTVPVIKTAAAITKKKKIGLLVTEATAKSAYNQHLIQQFAADCEVVVIGTNKIVPLIEAEKHATLSTILTQELFLFREKGVDVVVLGSTHFPILKKQIQEFLGQEVQILDSAIAIAQQVRRIITNNKMQNSQKHPTHLFYTTGKSKPFAQIAQEILKKSFPIHHVDLLE